MKITTPIFFAFLLLLTGCGDKGGSELESGMSAPQGKVLMQFVAATTDPDGNREFKWVAKAGGDFSAEFSIEENGKVAAFAPAPDLSSEAPLTITFVQKKAKDTAMLASPFTLQFESQAESTISKSGVLPGPQPTEPARESQGDHLQSEQLLGAGEKSVLIWWQSRMDQDLWVADGGTPGIEVYVDGKKTLLKDYAMPAWALTIYFNKK